MAGDRTGALAGAFLLLAVVGWAVALSLPPSDQRPLVEAEGAASSNRGYIGSAACRECHSSQYASWYRTYHRTMSQAVTPGTVLAPFQGETLHLGDQVYRLYRKQDSFWIEMPDPASQETQVHGRRVFNLKLPQNSLRVHRQVVQSTGSHHYQLYWYPSGIGRELYMLPFVWLKEDQRWAPRTSIFLAPPENVEERLIWNYQCLPCHSTDGRPSYPDDPAKAALGPDTRVVELGIACEACHGPGQAHASATKDRPNLVHPSRIAPVQSAQICGQCHSVNLPHSLESYVDWMVEGPRYRPGDNLHQARFVLRAATAEQSPLFRQWKEEGHMDLRNLFWKDGQVRVTGREYNGLLDSECFRSGELSCLNCHSMHSADPDDLLREEAKGDGACLSCHASLGTKIQAHTHHPPDSSGSRCYNCHMPHTSYGLLKAERSHTITSPSVRETIEAGRPNACNACHLDRPLDWTAGYLSRWYGQTKSPLPKGDRQIATGVQWMLQGDAGLRALGAWYAGWPPAREAAGTAWLAPILIQTLEDPYPAVRYIAYRGLRRLPQYAGFEYDFLNPAKDRLRTARTRVQPAAPNPATLIGPAGVPDWRQIERRASRRDTTPITLGE